MGGALNEAACPARGPADGKIPFMVTPEPWSNRTFSRDGKDAWTARAPVVTLGTTMAVRVLQLPTPMVRTHFLQGPHRFPAKRFFRKRRAGITFEGTLLVERQVRGYPANGCGRTEDEPLHVRPLHGQHEPHHSQDVVLVIRHGPNFGIAHPPSTPQGERPPSLTEHVVDGLFIPDVGVPKDERPRSPLAADFTTRSATGARGAQQAGRRICLQLLRTERSVVESFPLRRQLDEVVPPDDGIVRETVYVWSSGV